MMNDVAAEVEPFEKPLVSAKARDTIDVHHLRALQMCGVAAQVLASSPQVAGTAFRLPIASYPWTNDHAP